jgi:1-acyl-sn-glycerol-3-phosphate acyltransferase
MKKKKTILTLIVVAMAITSVTAFLINRHNEKQKKVYEALVVPKDQTDPDPQEDTRSSLKAGDVMVIFPEGHAWSDTEKQSYLLLKLTLTDDEAQELTQPQTKPSGSPTSDQTAGPPSDAKALAGKQEETVRARAYRLKIETLQFDINTIWKAQPFSDKVFDDKLIEKKKSN